MVRAIEREVWCLGRVAASVEAWEAAVCAPGPMPRELRPSTCIRRRTMSKG
eukprot:CAMPEP_0202409720 /NCGR_PEP_ID=MMETSP1128-20130828/17496_1 /ASSEMBLY_ACC=CAM_ASM_000463 /TAXON_ID=3047 /ORGANISM="Dunaliella tertiolecta, Strain CCMP1320" /LENGTH=50 /DNA_ID=CAMNT_0049015105 /DNA_START=759 /DNA_END=911 /DNA_ORIENTATION=+